MYAEEVKAEGYLDNDKRRALTLEFFKPIEEDCGRNFIFYYANYSNPLSEEEAPRYVLIGVSRILKLGEELFYENVSEDVAKRYAGGMIWARDITAAYPDEGVRLPYHRYADQPDRLAEIALFPENPFICKYGSKHLTDDEAIGLLEQFLAKVRFLRDIGDESEDWSVREAWLLKSIGELWRHRGLYPGLLKALDVAGATSLIDSAKRISIQEGQEKARAAAFEFLESGKDSDLTAELDQAERRKITRNWKLLEEGKRQLLRDLLPRLDLTVEAMEAIASEQRADCGITGSAIEIVENPYLIAEQYCGAEAGDRIPWSTIDRGVLPSPDLGGKPLAGVELNDERRFRALCCEHLHNEPNHCFRLAKDLLVEIVQRMDRLPAWKTAEFSERYFTVDAEFLSGALALRPTDVGLAVYLKSVFEDERLIERALNELVSRSDIDLRRPITSDDWNSWVFKSDSDLAIKASSAYAEATKEQASVCERLFRLPLSVVTGPAGTGKTTVIEALIRGVRRAEGDGAAVLVLAPTGKATDRAREVFEKASLDRVETKTIHSFLAVNGWLNDNLTFKRHGGKRAEVGTLIVDESSMLDLELAAALWRSINWQHVRRLILVGDAGQLPPIGRGRVFADVIKWLANSHPGNLGRLVRNLRQLLNRVRGDGTAIVALSELFILDDEDKAGESLDRSTRPDQEELVGRIHAGGNVDRDLEVIYWDEPEQLPQVLIDAIEARMTDGAGLGIRKPYKVWREALKDEPTAFQILTPHRGELHGVEALNEVCQNRLSKFVIDRIGALDGITLADKVIQIRNRPKSNPIWAYDWGTRKNVKVEVFNGEIGLVEAFGFEGKKLWGRVASGYRRRSLKQKAQELAEHALALRPVAPGTTHWDEVVQIWTAIESSNTEWSVPAYDGGLFTADKAVSPAGAALASIRLPNTVFEPALKGLLLIETDEAALAPVDFRSLGVREFGTIYEGLLESELSVADQDLALDAKGSYVPVKGRAQPVVTKGQIYLHNKSGARKSSGSYFTKSFAVEHLLDRALEPALIDHCARLDGLDETDAAESFFDFRVADIAMGSGHFLVAAVDRIERALTDYIARRPLPGVRNELLALKQAAKIQLGDIADQVSFEDGQLLRRLIARRCIYGVDLNALSVELSRLSIWIHTFVPGLPLTGLEPDALGAV